MKTRGCPEELRLSHRQAGTGKATSGVEGGSCSDGRQEAQPEVLPLFFFLHVTLRLSWLVPAVEQSRLLRVCELYPDSKEVHLWETANETSVSRKGEVVTLQWRDPADTSLPE